MKKLIFYVAATFIVVQCSSSSDDYNFNADLETKEIRKLVLNEEVAWNNGDAKSYSVDFDENGLFTNLFGMSFTGHTAFFTRHEQLLNGAFKGSVMKQDVTSLKIIDRNVAYVETMIRVTGFPNSEPLAGIYIDENGALNTRLLQVLKKEKNGWKIVAYHNIDIKKVVPIP